MHTENLVQLGRVHADTEAGGTTNRSLMLSSLVSRLRTIAVPVVMTLVGITAVGVIATLQQRADAARVAQNQVNELSITVERRSSVVRAVGPQGGLPTDTAQAAMDRFRDEITELSSELMADKPPAAVVRATQSIAAIGTADNELFSIAAKGGAAFGPESAPARRQLALYLKLDGHLTAAKSLYRDQARTARLQATLGTLITVMVLLAAFATYYFRSLREHKMARQLFLEKADLLEASRRDAVTDALTGLHNRRALTTDLADQLAAVKAGGDPLLVALFDLDGFKRYNDTFGHAAGDELLTRLGRSLRAEADRVGARAYRLGGDEFCVVYTADREHIELKIAAARAALTDEGAGWTIGTSAGVARVPEEASDVESALVLADERMYRDKATRKGQPSTLQTITAELRLRAEDGKTGPVAAMATAVAQHLNLPAEEVEALRVAADLHDIGKSAIPDSILSKKGELDDDEWAFVRSHTLTGGRLVFAAHARATTAALVRSSHEYFDGTGYPDGLAGTSIPLGARIIAVCDAFNAMTSERPFRTAMERDDALSELRACAGAQFDPAVVAAFATCGAGVQAPGDEGPRRPVRHA